MAVLVALVRLGLCANAMGSPVATDELLEGRALWWVVSFEMALRGAAFLLLALGLVRMVDTKARRALAGVALRVLVWATLTAAVTALVVLLHALGPRDLREGHPALELELVALACAFVSAGVVAGLGRQVARRS